jgi:hypothetical protein
MQEKFHLLEKPSTVNVAVLMKHELPSINSTIMDPIKLTEGCNPFPHLRATHIHNYSKFLRHKIHSEELAELCAKKHVRQY